MRLAFRPHEDDENAHRKRINSKTLSKVDKFENAVYASSCGRPYVKVYFRKRCENADVRCQRQSLLSSVELCHACENSIESCNNRYTGKLQKKKTIRWCASETIIMINFLSSPVIPAKF